MKESIGTFLRSHKKSSLPLLVGFSGGADSLALVLLLCELGCPIHLAHFDHAWRKESRAQAERLVQFASEVGVQIHTKRAPRADFTENGARNQRWEYFKELFASGDFEALVLAHHMDDQAETVLKRLLEGAHLHNLRAMEPLCVREEVSIWRPLLKETKQALRQFVDLSCHLPIEDESNGDMRYLRARMREEILPRLCHFFGKSVTAPLARLSHKGGQLAEYLEAKTGARRLMREQRGIYYDLSGAHPVEIDFVLSRAPFPTPSFHTLRLIYAAVEALEKNVSVSRDFLVDNGRVIWTKDPRQLKKDLIC